jgi:hypothetical protein
MAYLWLPHRRHFMTLVFVFVGENAVVTSRISLLYSVGGKLSETTKAGEARSEGLSVLLDGHLSSRYGKRLCWLKGSEMLN